MAHACLVNEILAGSADAPVQNAPELKDQIVEEQLVKVHHNNPNVSVPRICDFLIVRRQSFPLGDK